MAWFKRKPSGERGEKKKTAQEDAADEMARFEERDEVPRDPSDWPTGRASHLTYGNQGDEAYGEGATAKLGPAEVEHHEDGSVSVGGKLVDDPSAYKGKPITGGIIGQIDGQLARNREIREREERERGG
jgi:hypothetical protein